MNINDIEHWEINCERDDVVSHLSQKIIILVTKYMYM